MRLVRKAIFPVAGLGTRFLPATKAQPKEMLTLIDKPLIQFAVEEAIASGITHLIFVTGRTKRSIADHFDANPELDRQLRANHRDELADQLRDIIPSGVTCIYVRQAEARGLGHAVACAAPLIDDEPFAVLLADDLMEGPTPVLKQLIDAYEGSGQSVLAVNPVSRDEVSAYGIVDADDPGEGQATLIRGIVEKPRSADAPSNLAVVGRYVLDGSIMATLREQKPGRNGEIQLTDAIDVLARRQGVHALHFLGRRFDCGSKIGYLEATFELGLRHADYGPVLRKSFAKHFVREDE
jgi:UTP--glucose-1-phosphate uridylyltransferase